MTGYKCAYRRIDGRLVSVASPCTVTYERDADKEGCMNRQSAANAGRRALTIARKCAACLIAGAMWLAFVCGQLVDPAKLGLALISLSVAAVLYCGLDS